MAINYKVLGQVAPSASVATTLYTVPVDTQAIISSITVANRGTAAERFRVAVRPDGASLSNEHYVAYDILLNVYSTVALTLGITGDASDVVTVESDGGNLTFAAFGTEITL